MYSWKFQKYKKGIKKDSIKLTESEVEVYFSPKDNVYESKIRTLIANAKEEIYVSIFYLTYKPLIEELIKAQRRGVHVMVISDALGAYQFKDIIYNLRTNGIAVKAENWGGKNHEKTIMVDSEILLTGSSNFSKNGFNYNDENIIVIKNKKIAELYKDYFIYLFNSIDDKYLFRIPRAEGIESGNSCHDGIDNNFDEKTDKEDDGCK